MNLILYLYVCVYVYTHIYVLSICKLTRGKKKKRIMKILWMRELFNVQASYAYRIYSEYYMAIFTI